MGYFSAVYFGAPPAAPGISNTQPNSVSNYLDTRLALTYSDLVARLADRVGCESAGHQLRIIKRAVRDALRDLPTKNNWTYYNREWQFFTSAPSALNITYTNSNRVAVVNDGTIPSDAVYGQFYYNGIKCLIDSVSGSSLTLNPNANPGEDVTAADVTWTRQAYPAPSITKVNSVWRTSGTRALQYITPADMVLRDLLFDNTGDPVVFSIVNSSSLGGNDIIVSPPPGSKQAYKVSAIVAPAMPTLFREEGEATGVSGAFTFTAPEANSAWVGAVVRAVPSSSNKIEDIINEDWTWQAVITAVSGTTVTVNMPLPTTFVGEQVLVSSLIDIDIEAMQSYFEAFAYSYYAKNMNNEDREGAEAQASRLYLSARSADSKADRSTPHDMFVYVRYGGVFPDLRFERS